MSEDNMVVGSVGYKIFKEYVTDEILELRVVRL